MDSCTGIEDAGSFRKRFQDNGDDEKMMSDIEKWAKEAPLRYTNLPENDRATLEAVLHGRQPLEDLPHLKARVVRIFISSTFTDMAEERNVLIKKIYPKLRAYCRERHGIDFQEVDMRWGVPAHANDDHTINDLCIEEIINCQKYSIGPNFVAFLGQKYGYVNLPHKISRDVYEVLVQTLRDKSEDVDILKTWYKLDCNALTNVYVLQPISTILGEKTSEWGKAEVAIQNKLFRAAELCVEHETIPKEFLHTLRASVTENEITQGILKVKKQADCERNTVVIVRSFQEIESYLDRSKAARFFDMDEQTNKLNEKKHRGVMILRNEKVLPKVAKENVLREDVFWKEPLGLDPEHHVSYLEKVSGFFHERVRTLIDRNVEKQNRMQRDELCEEVLQQWYFARDLCDNFMGRQELLKEIESYVVGETHQALVVYGESGQGKTSVLAKAASEVHTWLGASGRNINTTVVLRFCGTTPASSNIRQLLHTLCHQIAFATNNFRHAIPKDYKAMKQYFRDIVQTGEFRGLVVIILDAINQLSAEDTAHKLDWLPPKISNNVKIIVSTTEEHGILAKLRGKIGDTQNFVKVEPLDPSQCIMILNACLHKAGRMISFEQCRVVKEAFTLCASPLFTKLLFEEAVRWKSYTPVDSSTLPSCVSHCIQKFFDRLEKARGKELVIHAMSYITASKTGLSKPELNDIMSIDDNVLNSIFMFWEPPLRRLPPNILPRIFYDIKGYLVERETDEATVLYWYHLQFVEAATQRYLSNPDHRNHIHRHLSDYFMGTWGGTRAKPFEYGEFLLKRLQRSHSNGTAVRYVPEQPLTFNTFTSSKRYNYRKLNQLPYHLYQAKRYLKLNTEVFFNYDWLYTKICACSVQQVISDLNMSDDREVTLLTDMFRMSEAALSQDPSVLGLEITGRLLPHYSKYPNIRRLIDQCDLESKMKCPIVPNWQVFSSPGGPLQYVCEADHAIKSEIDIDIIQCEDSVLLTAKPFHGTRMRIWDVTQGEPQPDLSLPAGTRVYPTPNGKYIHIFKNNRSLQTYIVDSGDLYGEVHFGHGNIAHIAVSNKYVAFTFDSAPSPVLIDTEARMLLQKFQYKCQAVAISRDERYFVCNIGQNLALHELPLMERTCIIPTGALPSKVVFTSTPSKLYVMSQSHELHRVMINLTQKRGKLSGVVNDIEMKDFMLSHTETMLLMRASRCLFLFDTKKDKIMHRIQKMPKGVFVEHLSTFKEAGFTPNDKMLVAARHTYLGVWDTATGAPLRLLQSSVTPIVRLFTSEAINKVITLLSDYSIQVWNLDDMDADVQHCNAVIRGTVTSMAAAQKGHRILCAGSTTAEAVVLNILTGVVERILLHTDEIGVKISSVEISANGKLAATRIENTDVPDYLKPWPLLKEDKIWNLDTGKMIQGVSSNRYIVFGDSRVVLFPCRSYSTFDWTITQYDIMVVHPDTPSEDYILELPEGDIVGQPLLVDNGAYLVFVLQKCERDMCSTIGSVQSNSSSAQVTFGLFLCVYSFEKVWKGVKYVDIEMLWTGATQEDNFIDVRNIDDDNVFLIYGKGTTNFTYLPDGRLDRSKHVAKGALIYSVRNGNVLHHLQNFMKANTNLCQTQVSSHGSILIDSKHQVFDGTTGKFINQMQLENVACPKGVKLLLDGKYAAVLSANRRELLIFRTSDGVQKARVFIHGTALHIDTCYNDRTIVLGCNDGRMAVFTLVLDQADHVKDIIQKLPSRKTTSTSLTNGNSVIKNDINNIQMTDGQLRNMAVVRRRDIVEHRRRSSSLKSMETAMHLTNAYNRVQDSKTCSIQ